MRKHQKTPKPGLFEASTRIEKKLAALIDDDQRGPGAWLPASSPPLLIYKIVLGLPLFSLILVRLIVSTVSRLAWRL
jgi:hypothetical protein